MDDVKRADAAPKQIGNATQYPRSRPIARVTLPARGCLQSAASSSAATGLLKSIQALLPSSRFAVDVRRQDLDSSEAT